MNWLCGLAGMLVPLGVQDTIKFRVGVELVYVDAFVSLDGEPVGGLTAEDFEVYDDGERQRVELIDAASLPRSVVLLVDRSASISGKRRELLVEALKRFADQLNEDDECAVLSFAEQLTLDHPMALGLAMENVALDWEEGRATALSDAVYLTLQYLRGAEGRPLLIVFTDGEDNASWTSAEALLHAVRTSEVVVYAVNVRPQQKLAPGGSSARGAERLEELTRFTGGRLVWAEHQEELTDAYRKILSEVSTRYLLAFTPPPDARPGWHDLRVEITGASDASVRTRSGYVLSNR